MNTQAKELPIIMGEEGVIPQSPAYLFEQIINLVKDKVPGFTASLPPALITDLASTSVAATAVIDHARVDLINSLTPFGANIKVLTELANIYGIARGTQTNPSVEIVFYGLPGFYIGKGFLVGDGNHQYAASHPTVITTKGMSEPILCISTSPGTWAIPEGTVTQIITSVAKNYNITCTNLIDGVPGSDEENVTDWRSRILRAGMFTVQGTPDCLYSRLSQIQGVDPIHMAFRQPITGKWVVVVLGGDPNHVAHAIYETIPDLSTLTNHIEILPDDYKKSVTIYTGADNYVIPYVNPKTQNVWCVLLWNSIEVLIFDADSMTKLFADAFSEYVNLLPIGVPINTLIVQDLFLNAINDIVEISLISRVAVTIYIDGNIVNPEEGTSIVRGHEYGFFKCIERSVIVKEDINSQIS